MADSPRDSSQRVVAVDLDQGSIRRWSHDIEHERAVAIYDLLEENYFSPVGEPPGPYAVTLAVEENRLSLDIRTADGGTPIARVVLPLAGFRRVVRDYFTVCENYFAAIRNAPPARIEALDQGRRALHDEGSELLKERLAPKIEVDFSTARRLFTLMCVLHLRL